MPPSAFSPLLPASVVPVSLLGLNVPSSRRSASPCSARISRHPKGIMLSRQENHLTFAALAFFPLSSASVVVSPFGLNVPSSRRPALPCLARVSQHSNGKFQTSNSSAHFRASSLLPLVFGSLTLRLKSPSSRRPASPCLACISHHPKAKVPNKQENQATFAPPVSCPS